MLLLALPLALAIGVSLGALGGGGSILTVPALVYALGQDPLTATTSSLIIVGITSLIALVPHARARRVRFGQGLLFGVLGTAGSFVGSALSGSVDPKVLLTTFAGLMLVVAGLMFRRVRRARWGAGGQVGGLEPMLRLSPFTCVCRRVAVVVLAATGVGLLTGFFGVGGGFVLVPALVLALGFPMPTAVGTSLLVIAVNSATALVARLGSGTAGIDCALIGAFTAAAVVGSLLGSRIAGRADPRKLTTTFAALLVLVALYTLARSTSLLA